MHRPLSVVVGRCRLARNEVWCLTGGRSLQDSGCCSIRGHITSLSSRPAVTHSGRLVLRELRRRNICLQNHRINRIRALVRRGWKMRLTCHQFDYTCGIVTTSFAAPHDVTGAGWTAGCEVPPAGLTGAGNRHPQNYSGLGGPEPTRTGVSLAILPIERASAGVDQGAIFN